MSRQDIIDKLRTIIIAATDGKLPEKYDESSRLVEDFGFNSVGMLFVVIAVEEEFNIRFDNVGMADFVTLGDVVDYIQGKTK